MHECSRLRLLPNSWALDNSGEQLWLRARACVDLVRQQMGGLGRGLHHLNYQLLGSLTSDLGRLIGSGDFCKLRVD